MDPHTEPSAVEVIRDPRDFQARLIRARHAGQRVAFVPTMGALHEGHLTLAREGRARVGPEGLVAISIFVNPTQFGPNEDLSKYPRELSRDLVLCASAGVDVVFAPDTAAMYPEGEQTRVTVSSLTAPLCGVFRPGHFEGVTTIVSKLFALSGPCVALFGRKDYQQWRVIERMTRDLLLPVEVVGVPTVREANGLALSSRNRYLSDDERARAAEIPRALGYAVREWESGARDAARIRDEVDTRLRAIATSVDYIEVRDADTLEHYRDESTRAVLAIAVRVGTTRLIDNVVLGEESAPV
ncbi:MAG: pantoate--beta-alanine ligase [Deltaproteobacteria bacterium]|nr:pantoate--beta-alanine ligase [Deltaproteobacteria bacterium]